MDEHQVVTSGFMPVAPTSFFIYCSCGWGYSGRTAGSVVTMPRDAAAAWKEHVDSAVRESDA